MTTTATQQVTLDNALVPPEKRVEIGKCNMRINPAKTQKEPTYQVVLDALALTTCYPAFLITADVPEIYMHQFWFTIDKKDSTSYRFKIDKKRYKIVMEVFREILQICPRLPNQEFDALPSDEEIVYFIKELGHKGDIKSFTDVVVDQMQQPWRTFALIINKCLSGKIIDFAFQIENRDKALVAVEEPPEKPVKKHAARRQSAGVQIRDTPGVYMSKKKAPTKAARSKGIELLSEAASLKEAQLKKDIKRSKREKNIHQAGGSSEGAGLEPEVPDEQKGKSSDISEGIGLKPRVPDVSKPVSSKKYNDDNKAVDLNKTDDDEEDEFIHTPDDYVPTDDENVDAEEFERINKEMYSDVNVEFKDLEHESEGIDNKEMTDVGQVDAEHENVSQEVVGDQDKDDVQATITAALATQKTKVSLQSSSISSDYAVKFLNFDNIPSGETEIISMMDIKIQHEDPSIQTSPLLTVLVTVIPKTSSAQVTTIPQPITLFITLP
ncbi:hypothetical protein Tco_0374752 [Tanacetum coccineum]